MSRPTVSRPICLNQFFYCQTVAGLLMWGALSDERAGLSFTIAADPRQRSHSRVRVPWGSRQYFSQIRDFPFRRLLRLAGYGGGIRPRLHTEGTNNSRLNPYEASSRIA
jgi:hypothetical protein